jgi:hypothetical protein
MVIDLMRECYADFSRALAAEKPAETYGLRGRVETLRQWMLAKRPVDRTSPPPLTAPVTPNEEFNYFSFPKVSPQ